MPRKPTLSPSKITTYLACPVRYRWTYVDPRGRWYLRSKSYYSFGTTLHRVLQRFHDANDIGVETVDQAMAVLEESWIDAGYSSAQEMQEALGEGKAIVQAHVERAVLAGPSGAETIHVEKQFRLDMGDFDLIGRVDRLDRWPDGSLEIVDYKTGRSDVSPEDVQNDLAMACYQLLVGAAFPGSLVRATILAVRTGARASYALSPGELSEFRDDLQVLGAEILSREWSEIEPVAKALCPGCDFLALCAKHPEFDPTPFQQ